MIWLSNNIAIYFGIISLVNLFFISKYLILSLPDIKKSINMSKFKWSLLILVLFLAFILRAFIFPKHFNFFLDDFYALEIADKIIHLNWHNLDRPNFIFNGLFFVLPRIFFGNQNFASFLTVIFFSILSLFFYFFLTKEIIKNYWGALFGTIYLAFNLRHIIYSSSPYNHMFSFFLAIFCLYSFFLYLKNKKLTNLYLSVFLNIYLFYIRVEYVLLSFFLFALYYFNLNYKSKKKINWKPWLIICFFISIGAIGFFQRIFNILISKNNGTTFDPSSFFINITRFSDIIGFPNIFLMILIISIIHLLVKKKKNTLILISASISLIGLYLCLKDVDGMINKYFLFSNAILFLAFLHSILIFSRENIKIKLSPTIKVISFILLIISLMFITVNQSIIQKNKFRTNFLIFDMKLPNYLEKNLEEDCMIFTVLPEKYSVPSNLNVFDIDKFDKKNDKCSLFVDDWACYYPIDDETKRCKNFKETHNLTIYMHINSTMIKLPNTQIKLDTKIYKINT